MKISKKYTEKITGRFPEITTIMDLKITQDSYSNIYPIYEAIFDLLLKNNGNMSERERQNLEAAEQALSGSIDSLYNEGQRLFKQLKNEERIEKYNQLYKTA